MKALSIPAIALLSASALAQTESPPPHAAISPDQLAFFEKNIRPVLVEH